MKLIDTIYGTEWSEEDFIEFACFAFSVCDKEVKRNMIIFAQELGFQIVVFTNGLDKLSELW